MDVAVAQVAESDYSNPRLRRLDLARRSFEKLRYLGQWHRDVVLNACAFGLLTLRNAFADAL